MYLIPQHLDGQRMVMQRKFSVGYFPDESFVFICRGAMQWLSGVERVDCFRSSQKYQIGLRSHLCAGQSSSYCLHQTGKTISLWTWCCA